MRGKRKGFEGEGVKRVIFRGAAFARRRETAAMSSLSSDINVQFSGIEMSDSRQRWHT